MKFQRSFFLIAIVSATIYMVLLPLFHPYPLSFALKALPAFSLTLIVVKTLKEKDRVFAGLALLFCMAGDILFDLDRVANFKIGLAAFLLGHIFYVILYIRKRSFQIWKIYWIIGISLFAIVMAILLRNIEQGLLIPVYAYLLVISLMTIAAFLRKNFSPMIAAGALVFLASDTIIAINKFLQPIPYSTVYNISLYFIAQILMIRGLVNEENTF